MCASPLKDRPRTTGCEQEDFLAATRAPICGDALDRWILGDEPFTARLNPDLPVYNDYDQLMRLDEWLRAHDARGGRSMSGAASIPLQGNQMKAVEPEETVWLSASAGHRQDAGAVRARAAPAAAARCRAFADPVPDLHQGGRGGNGGAHQRQARALGAAGRRRRWSRSLRRSARTSDPKRVARARTLFASVLDCPGGGLRIDTIHAFSQWLLGAFPRKPGSLPARGRWRIASAMLLARQVLADLLVDAESEPLGDPQLLAALADLEPADGAGCGRGLAAALRRGARGVVRPGRVARADARATSCACSVCRPMQTRTTVADAVRGRYFRRRFAAALHGDQCRMEREDRAGRCRSHCANGLPAIAGRRCGRSDALAGRIPHQEGRSRAPANRRTRSIRPIPTMRAGGRMHRHGARHAQSAGARRTAGAGAAAGRGPSRSPGTRPRQREGLIDFDDQIRRAADLLDRSELADWIRYKLDRRFDHILVDEAQDTNEAQWRIIDALTGEFFAGIGQRGDKLRTLFVVGDYKQAIFRFQGTSPENFEARAQAGQRCDGGRG